MNVDGSTSNLFTHLKRRHSDVHAAIQKQDLSPEQKSAAVEKAMRLELRGQCRIDSVANQSNEEARMVFLLVAARRSTSGSPTTASW